METIGIILIVLCIVGLMSSFKPEPKKEEINKPKLRQPEYTFNDYKY